MSSASGQPRLSVLSALRPATASVREEIGGALTGLLGTVRLASAVDLSGHPAVARSVLNYGMPDISRLTVSETGNAQAMRDLREAILAHETRIEAGSLIIEAVASEETVRQTVQFRITAELRADPVELEIAFAASADAGTARFSMSDLKVT